ncbi:MAG: hypothetical protein AAGG57_14885 [Pseudomonadota bacterium]
MSDGPESFSQKLAVRCRDVAALLIGGLWIGRDTARVVSDVASLPVRQQAMFTIGVLGLLFLFSLFAAQFGLIGMALYWLSVIAIVA